MAGKNRGLSLILDSHSNLVSPGTVAADFNGFLAFVGPKTDFPMMTEGGILLRPGQENFVEISAQRISSDAGVRELGEEQRKCRFEDETALALYRNYTHTNCKFECYIRHAEAARGCVPWFLPKTDGMVVCDPWTARLFLEDLQSSGGGADCSHCLPDCETTRFESAVNSAPFRRCDSRNMGLTTFCDLDADVHPTIWSHQAGTEHNHPLICM